METLVFATNNQNKASEIQDMLSERYKILTLKDIGCDVDIPETAETLEGNAKIKSEYVLKHFERDVFADDTGLEVDALDGAPGVYSARYAGGERSSEANMNKLLEALAGNENRAAQFRTVISLEWKGETHFFEGIVRGNIAEAKTGKDGFGYDPIFIPEGETRSFAEMEKSEKNEISHRGRAVRKLVDFLQSEKA